MSDSKPGFFKRLFKFGRSKEAEETADIHADERAALEAREVEEAQKLEAERKAAEKLVAQEQEEARKALEAENQAADERAAEAERITEEEAQKAEDAAKEAAAAKVAADEKEAQEQEILRQEEERLEAERTAQEIAEKQKALEQAQKLEQEQETARIKAEEDAAKERAKIEAKAAAEREAIEAEEARALADKKAQEDADKLKAEEEAERIQAQEEEAERIRAAELQKQKAESADNFDQSTDDGANLNNEEPAPRKSWFSRMREGLSRSSNQLTENITAVFTKRKLDEDTLQDLEDILIQADLGVETAMKITDSLASQRMGKDVSDEEVREFMAEEVEKVLDPVASELELDLDHTPHVILVVGVNGSGKTTTIGKLSQKLYDAGFSTSLVAGDTFRAAAIEQLKIWGERTQSPVLFRPLGSDAAGLAFDAYTKAKEEGRDVMLMDTAGRLQNKTELMDELEKIIRVLKKHDASAPHTVLLTLDATTGQNALNQVEIFKDVAGVNGLVMTKMDGTARGGIMVAIAAKFKLPVYFIGVGEQVEDLEPFEAREFARSIAGLDR